MDRIEKNIEELLFSYCEGKLSSDERKHVEEWITASKENEELAKIVHELYWAADTLSVMDKVDAGNALKKAKGKLVRKKLKTVFLWTERAAAIMFIPLLSAYLLQIKNSDVAEARMMEIRTNPGMTTAFVLPDGTNVSLNSGSVLRYPEFFSEDKREVELIGEAFFDVTKDPNKRFVVKTTGDERVEVLGTSFNMEAFPGDSILSTTLLEGKVRFVSDAGSVQMNPGEKLVYNNKTSKAKLTKTNGEAETAWKYGKVIFNNTPFNEVLRMLSKRFNVDFVVKNEKYRKDSFTGTFSTQRLEQVLDVFSISSKIKWRYIPTDKTEEKRSKIEVY
ncbi:MAG: DUF4974 domain-containing protein [Parabacteroides sp.]|nr:DUF4974 domain-containing protein [Parabacteroides sp.]